MVTLDITDLTPRFLTFYEPAAREEVTPEEHWQLWQTHYGFAAVPPTPEGQARARTLLEAAWPQYPAVLSRIRAGVSGMTPAPHVALRAVTDLLDFQDALSVGFIGFVGFCEGNAYGYVHNGKFYVCMPVEQDPLQRTLMLPHEFTHAIHWASAGLSGGWERSIAEVILQEGLATQVTKVLIPGREIEAYIEYNLESTRGWFAACQARHTQILEGIQAYLGDNQSETVWRFTMGTGTTGLEREAYYVGWHVVDYLMTHNQSLAAIARIPANDMEQVVHDSIHALLTTAR